jgi:hypothetical protein
LTRRLQYPATAAAQSPRSAIGLINRVVPARFPMPVRLPIAGTTPPGAKAVSHYCASAYKLDPEFRSGNQVATRLCRTWMDQLGDGETWYPLP